MDIIEVESHHHGLVKGMYQCYLHDISEFEAPYKMDENGCWQPDYLPFWLGNNDGAMPHLIRYDDQFIGLAFVGAHPFPYMNPNRDYRFCEFFILRAFRGDGLGRKAARAVLQKYGGHWEMVVLPENQAALSFWRTIIDDLQADRFRRETTEEGIIYSFVMPS